MARGARPNCSPTTATSRASGSLPGPGSCPEPMALLARLDRAAPQLLVPGLVPVVGDGGRVHLAVVGPRRRRCGWQVEHLLPRQLIVQPAPGLVRDTGRILVPRHRSA